MHTCRYTKLRSKTEKLLELTLSVNDRAVRRKIEKQHVFFSFFPVSTGLFIVSHLFSSTNEEQFVGLSLCQHEYSQLNELICLTSDVHPGAESISHPRLSYAVSYCFLFGPVFHTSG